MKKIITDNYIAFLHVLVFVVLLCVWLFMQFVEQCVKYNNLKKQQTQEIETRLNLLQENEELEEVNEDLQEEITRLNKQVEQLEKELEEQPQWTSLGVFKITAYGIDCLGCTGITKSGTVPQTGRTIAVDPTVIPLGSKVLIDGQVYIAEDTGGAIQGKVIDLFYNTEQESAEFGVQYHKVYILEGE